LASVAEKQISHDNGHCIIDFAARNRRPIAHSCCSCNPQRSLWPTWRHYLFSVNSKPLVWMASMVHMQFIY